MANLSVEELKNQLNRLLDNSINIYETIDSISINVTNIEEASETKTRIMNIFNQSSDIVLLLSDYVRTNPQTTLITDIREYDDERVEVNLFNEINKTIEELENMVEYKTDSLYSKILILENIGNAKEIPEDENELRILNEQIITQSTCSICTIRVVNIKIDCGHLFCINCAINLTECPLCRTPIDNYSKIYLKKYLKYKNKYLKLKK